MALHDTVVKLRAKRIELEGKAIPVQLQGVTKQKITQILSKIDLNKNIDLLDCIYALLDNETESWFTKAPAGTKFSDGATTAHLCCHIGILQRGKGKLDREGRDYWIKPLGELGGIEPILLHNDGFIHGHVIPKSGNSCYRLTEEFKSILQAPNHLWPKLLDDWAQQDAAIRRRIFQAEMAEASRLLVDTGHSDLIQASITHYAKKFLPGYELIYVDDGDGDRITDTDKQSLARAGINLNLGGAMPDALFWNPETNRLWVIEAVTSDGEVDIHKVNLMTDLANRHGKSGIDFTTTYLTWKEAAARQGTHGNIAIGSYIWIQADPAKHFRVESFE